MLIRPLSPRVPPSHKDARTHAASGPSRVRRRLSTARLGDPISLATVMRFWEIRTVSNSAQLRSFRLNICIDAPASTKNSLSSGFITDAAGRHHTSVSEKKLPLSFALSFNTPFAILYASAGASLLPFRLFLRPILNFWSVRTALVRTGALNHTKRWTFAFPNICVTLCVFWELHGVNWSQNCCTLPWNGIKFRLHVRDTQPNCREFLNIPTAPWSLCFFCFLLGSPSTCWCITAHFLNPNLHPDCF